MCLICLLSSGTTEQFIAFWTAIPLPFHHARLYLANRSQQATSVLVPQLEFKITIAAMRVLGEGFRIPRALSFNARFIALEPKQCEYMLALCPKQRKPIMKTNKKAVQFYADPDVEQYLNSLESGLKGKTINAALRAYKASTPRSSTRLLVPEVNSFIERQPDRAGQLEKRVAELELAMREVQRKLNRSINGDDEE